MKRIVLIDIFLSWTILVLSENSFLISEVNINPLGSDSGREWVEIKNTGSQVLIDGFNFKEGASTIEITEKE